MEPLRKHIYVRKREEGARRGKFLVIYSLVQLLGLLKDQAHDIGIGRRSRQMYSSPKPRHQRRARGGIIWNQVDVIRGNNYRKHDVQNNPGIKPPG